MDYVLNNLIGVLQNVLIIILLVSIGKMFYDSFYSFSFDNGLISSKQPIGYEQIAEVFNITFIDIDPADDKAIFILKKFYDEIFCYAFIDQNQRESLENLIAYLKNNLKTQKYEYRIIIAMRGEEILGGIIGDYYLDINSAFIEFIVVSDNCRKQNIGTKLTDALINTFNNIALLSNKHKLDYIFVEIENPNKIDESEFLAFNPYNRLRFWEKNQFSALDTLYLQPRLGNDKKSVSYLILGVRVYNEDLDKVKISTKRVKKFIYDYGLYSTLIDDPLRNEDVLSDCLYLVGEKQKIISFDDYINKYK